MIEIIKSKGEVTNVDSPSKNARVEKLESLIRVVFFVYSMVTNNNGKIGRIAVNSRPKMISHIN